LARAFLQGNGTLRFAPEVGQIQIVSDAIGDQSGNGGTVANGTDGSWELAKIGAGTLVLGNPGNSFTGGVAVAGGTLSIVADGALGIGGTLALGNGTILALAAGGDYSHALTVAGAPTIDTEGAAPATWSGPIGGLGSLTKLGPGILTLTGINTYTGGTTVAAGTLGIAADGALGAVNGGLALGGATTSGKLVLLNPIPFLSMRAVTLGAGGGAIDTEGASPATLGGPITGPGGLTKLGAGTLALSGTSTYLGPTTIASGTLQAGAAGVFSAASTFAVASDAALDLNAFNQTIGSLSGAGNVTLGKGSLSTGGDNSSTTFSGVISGAGSLVKLGVGTFVLTGANSYTGGTTISGGGLQGNTTSLQGNIVDNARLVFDQATTGIFAGSITGTGSLVKQNSGLLALNGNSSAFAGTTSITSGILEIGDPNNPAAKLGGNVTVGPAGTLAGHGTIGGSVSNMSGMVVPGGSIGTLTVGGNFTQGSAGTLVVEVSPTGVSQLVVGGKASLAGTLALVYDPGTYAAKTYTLVQAASVTGSFSTVTGQVPTPGLTQSVTIDPTDVQLALTNAPAALTLAPTNDTIFPAMTSTLILNGQRANVMVLDRLGSRLGGGANAPATASLVAPASPQFARAGSSNLATLDEIATALPEGMAQYGGWFRGIGSFAALNGNASAPGFGANSGGFLVGIDRPVEPDLYLGAAGGYIHTGVQEHSTSSGDTDTGRFMLYGGGWAGPALWTATAGYAHDGINTARGFAGVGTAREAHGGNELTLAAQGSVPMMVNGATVTPKAGVPFLHLHESAFGETGANGLDLSSGPRSTDSLQPYVALSVAQTFGTPAETQVTPELRLGYSYEVLSNSRVLTVGTLDGTNFLVQGVNPSRNMLTAGVGVTVRARDDVFLYANYHALVRTGNTTMQTVSAGLRIRF
jgi:fibronectin-binding autotransporter adhesin